MRFPKHDPTGEAAGESGMVRSLRLGLAALFLLAGVAKLVGAEPMRETFEHFGYSAGFRLLVGTIEILGAVGLLTPRLSVLAACGLCAVMVGAIFNAVAYGPMWMALPPLVVLALLVLVAARESRADPLRSRLGGAG